MNSSRLSDGLTEAAALEASGHRLELQMARLLRGGVLSAGAIVCLGGLIYLLHHAFEPVAYSHFHGVPSELRHLDGILAGAAHLSGRSIIQLGVLLLIATPIARVAFSAISFLRQRDTLYVVLTLIVLMILVIGLLQGMFR